MSKFLFTYWMLVASWQMGVPAYQVVVDDDVVAWAWAAMCADCEPRRYEVTTALLEYGDPTFLKLTAYHEVCHNWLGHGEHWVTINADDPIVEMEENAANSCVTQHTGVTLEEIKIADDAALRWDETFLN
jgi:hypothetical protein